MTEKEKSGPSLMAKIRNAGLHIVKTSGETVTKKLYDKDGTLIADPSGTTAAIGAVDARVDAVEDEIGDREAPVAGTVRADIAELGRRIEAITITGRYLSGWNCVTGQPDTQPSTLPYTYPTGGFYIVSNVSTDGPNFMPSGGSYTGAASTAAAPEGTKIYDIFKYDGSAWSKIPTSGIVVSFGSIAGDPMDNVALAAVFSGKADDSSVVKLSGAQTIDGRKSFNLAPVSQDIITGVITTDKWKKIMECAVQSMEIDALIAVTLYWCKGDILHVRFSQTEGYNEIKKFIKGTSSFAAGRFCTAFNSTTGAVELWTAESRCAAYVLYAAHVSQSQPLTLPLLYATADSPEGDKPEVGETYAWVKDSPA